MKKIERIKSITKCKLCGKDFITEMQQCQYCNRYSFFFRQNAEEFKIESETISSGNFYLVFFPEYKEANIVSKQDDGNNKVKRIKMEELTPELAEYWVQKLKKICSISVIY